MEFDAEKGRKIISAIRDGTPYQYAAEANGIREWQLNAWMEEGLEAAQNGKDSNVLDFALGVRKAEENLIRKMLKKIRVNAKAWKNSAWLLERIYPRHFGKDSLEFKDMQFMLLSLREDIESLKDQRIAQKPVVKQLDDALSCSNDTQGASS